MEELLLLKAQKALLDLNNYYLKVQLESLEIECYNRAEKMRVSSDMVDGMEKSIVLLLENIESTIK